MCDFCTEHGDGKKWYLNAKNYAGELARELERQEFIGQFYKGTVQGAKKDIALLEKLLMVPLVGKFAQRKFTKGLQKSHFGQVIPKEDTVEIVKNCSSIVRVACGCTWEIERRERRVCLAVSLGLPNWYDGLDLETFGSPDVSRMEYLTKEEAIGLIGEYDKKRLVHTVWTFKTPFIGGICNCNQRECLAMRATNNGLPAFFRAEYIAFINYGECDGCRACVKSCGFGAINYLPEAKKCFIDYKKCYGCGICRVKCKKDAIVLVERKTTKVKDLWL